MLQNLSLKLLCSFVSMGQWNFAALFDDNRFQLKAFFFFLIDIFSFLNKLGYFLQGKNKSQLEAAEKISSFKKKLSLRKKRVRGQNFAMFLLLDSKIGDQEINEWLTASIDKHISNLAKKSKITFQHLKLLQHEFSCLLLLR